MAQKKERWIQSAYMLYVEDPNDIVFRVDGIVFFDQFMAPDLYCQDSRFNFLRTILNRYSIEELRKGIKFRDHHIELRPLPDRLQLEEPFSPEQIPGILKSIRSLNPIQFWFLNPVQQ